MARKKKAAKKEVAKKPGPKPGRKRKTETAALATKLIERLDAKRIKLSEAIRELEDMIDTLKALR